MSLFLRAALGVPLRCFKPKQVSGNIYTNLSSVKNLRRLRMATSPFKAS